VHLRRAWRELRALIADPDDTDRAVSLMYAIGRREFERNFQRFAASPGGRAMLAELPSLLAALSDRGALAHMPRSSLGRAYLDYLEHNGFAPDGLLVVQNRVQANWEREDDVAPLDPLRTWYRERTLLLHDLLHVLTEYGTDEVGEGTLLAFSLAQFPAAARRGAPHRRRGRGQRDSRDRNPARVARECPLRPCIVGTRRPHRSARRRP
jgi:ubiquinone biosynthesis protein COQ4